ncbi:polyhydroxyalkanoic acid system family protein [Candidatus Kaiserbacteria bacterium]|nr:polyhydroxyalkanoic acid system family protein [Candidatus Kaiserbacteria bacterium]
MQIILPHKGTQEEGVAHIKRLLQENRAKIQESATDLKEEWDGNVLDFAFTAQGSHISGTLTIRDKEFDLYAKLPLAMRLFEGTIERMIAAEAQKLKLD